MSLTAGYVQRADTKTLRAVFDKYASVEVEGRRFMTGEDFLVTFLGLLPAEGANQESMEIFLRALTTNKDGRISYGEFQKFERSLCVPDALYKTAFHLFDTKSNGVIGLEEFKAVVTKTTLYQKIPFNFDCDMVKLYFGREGKRSISYNEFCQFLHDFHDEYASVAFRARDPQGTGFVSAVAFEEILLSIKSHLVTESVGAHLRDAANAEYGDQKVSYAYFTAFLSLLSNMDLIKKIYLNATNNSKTVELTKEDFIYSAQMMSQITPLEIDVLFSLCSLIHATGKVRYDDFTEIAPEQYMKQVTQQVLSYQAVTSPDERNFGTAVLESVYRFVLGSVAGATGAAVVYPIDLVKTRMQNMRTGSYIGEIVYKSSFDCFGKVLRHEGFSGLYRGLLPQLMGVAPEKAIKLTMNDLVRDKLREASLPGSLPGDLPLWGEVLAGGAGGASQVMFTNPLEIVKIRLQVAGEVFSAGQKVSALGVVKELGLRGLYKGSQACFMRDIPFSMIYFPSYAHFKPLLADETGYNSPGSLLLAAAMAGCPAASLVTPADVIKTRLQVKARAGQTVYNGTMDAARKIYAEEGFKAFWKGSVARMCRSSPQFGVTLVTYELLQRYLYVDFGGSRPTGQSAVAEHNPDLVGGYKAARPIFTGVESKFGLLFPKFAPTSSS